MSSRISRRKKFILVLAVCFIVVIGLLLLFVRYLNGPSEGQVNNLAPITSTASSFNLSPVSVTGTYISFNYPASLKDITSTTSPNTASSGATLENYLYQYHDSQTWLLAISVNHLTQPALSYDSSYSLRKDDPSRYQESTLTVGSKTFIVMKDLTAPGFAQVAFILNGTTSADISLYGDDQYSLDNLQKTFSMVLNSFQWKQ